MAPRRRSEIALHAHALAGIEPKLGFVIAHGTQLRGQLVVRQHSETKVGVERTIPRHAAKRRQRERLQALFRGPHSHSVHQLATDAAALRVGDNADLFNVGRVSDSVDHDVADDAVAILRNEAAPAIDVRAELVERERIVVRDIAHADRTELLAGFELDLSQPWTVSDRRGADFNNHPSSLTETRYGASTISVTRPGVGEGLHRTPRSQAALLPSLASRV